MKYQLSICIPTLNRGDYIGATLESIVGQLQEGVEIVIVDGGSTDDTESVVGQYLRSFPEIRYIRIPVAAKRASNEGFDRDCAHAVEVARGEYCWLMTDDDLLVPGALKRVLEKTYRGYALIVATVEVRNKDLSEILVPSRPDLTKDKILEPGDMDQLAINAVVGLSFVGAVIVKRAFWVARDAKKYFGTGFVHVGVIFDKPIDEESLVMAIPLVSIRHGNAQWTSRAFRIWMFNWPRLVWSFSTISERAKRAVCPKEPWRSLTTLLGQRALGAYSIREYRELLRGRLQSKASHFLARVIAQIPRCFLYAPAYLYARVKLASPFREIFISDLRSSWRQN